MAPILVKTGVNANQGPPFEAAPDSFSLAIRNLLVGVSQIRVHRNIVFGEPNIKLHAY